MTRARAMIRSPLHPLLSAACVLTALALSDKPLSAGSLDPSLTVTENGKTLGKINMMVNKNGAVIGSFEVTLQDPKTKKPYTLAGLAKALGEDHFNWFQDYTVSKDFSVKSLKDPAKPDDGTVSHAYKKGETIIDPQSGGQCFKNSKGEFKLGLWADNVAPWYYNESDLPKSVTPPKTAKSEDGTEWKGVPGLQLSAKTSGSILRYGDLPHNKDLTDSFTTFLVSVGPGNTYKPLAGFTWTAVFDKNGKNTTTIDTEKDKPKDLKPATFTKDMNDEINKQGFGKWKPAKGSIAPEPSTLMLLASGLLGSVPFALRRRRLRQRLPART